MDQALPFPTEQQRRNNFFWTRKTPRPTAETHPYVFPPLSEVQAIWDAAAKQVSAHEAYVAEQETARAERDKAAAAEREQAYAAAEAKRSADREAILRGQYFASGGNEAGWERDREKVLSLDAIAAMQRQQKHGGALISKQEAFG